MLVDPSSIKSPSDLVKTDKVGEIDILTPLIGLTVTLSIILPFILYGEDE